MGQPQTGAEAPDAMTAKPVKHAFREGVMIDMPGTGRLLVRPDVPGKSQGNADALFERSWQLGAYAVRARQIHSKYDVEGVAIVMVQWWPSRPRFELMDRMMRRKYRRERHAVVMAFSKHINAGVTVVETE